MAYKPPGTYARFVSTVSSVVNAGNARILALVGTGINYFTVENEAVTKSSTKPYDELSNGNVFEILSVSSRPIYDNLITSDNVIYKEKSATNKGYSVNDNIISWSCLQDASCTIDGTFCPEFVENENITVSINESADIPAQDGEWMIEVSYISEDDDSNETKLGCYRVINTLTGEIVGEYVVSDTANNEYPIPGVNLVVKNTFIKKDGEQKVFVGDYAKITTTAAKTEVEAKVEKVIPSSSEDIDLGADIITTPSTIDSENPVTNITLNFDKIFGAKSYEVYVQTSNFNTTEDGDYITSNAVKIDNYSEIVPDDDEEEEEATTVRDYEIKLDNVENADETKNYVLNTIYKNTSINGDMDDITVKAEAEFDTDNNVTKITITPSELNGRTCNYTIKTIDDQKLPSTSSKTGTIKGSTKFDDAEDIEVMEFITIEISDSDSTVKRNCTINISDLSTTSNFNATVDVSTVDLTDVHFYFLILSKDSNDNIIDYKTINTGSTSEDDDEPINGFGSPSDMLTLYNAINDLQVINNSTLYEKYAIYKLTYHKDADSAQNKIKIERYVDGKQDTTYSEESLDVDYDFYDVIPGIDFVINVDALESINSIGDTSIFITTSPRVTSNDIPSEGSTYYVSYKYRKSDVDYEPMLFTDYDDIVAEYGNYDVSASSAVLNSLSLGAEIAYNNGVSMIVCVQAKNNSDYEMEAAIDKLSKAIAGASNVSTIVPLTDSAAVGSYLANHVTLMSSYEYGKERMGYLAASINQPINKLATRSDSSIGMAETASGFNNERIVYVVPGAIKKSIRDLRTGKYNERTLPGCYAAVAVASIGLANDPAEPLTNKTLAGFTELVDLYSESEKNILAAAGCCVLEPSGTNIRIRHGITTNTDAINSQEITLIQIKDYVIDSCRTETAGLYIGRKLTASIISDVNYTMTSLLNNFVSQGVIINYSSLKVKRNSEEPRQIDVSFEIEAVYPLNWISIEFGFSAVS